MFPIFCISKGFQIIKQSSGKSGGSSDTPKALAPNLGGHSATEKCENNAKQRFLSQTSNFTFFTAVSIVICSSAFAFVSPKSELNTFASVQTRIGQARIQFSIQNMTVACKKGKKERQKGVTTIPYSLGKEGDEKP